MRWCFCISRLPLYIPIGKRAEIGIAILFGVSGAEKDDKFGTFYGKYDSEKTPQNERAKLEKLYWEGELSDDQIIRLELPKNIVVDDPVFTKRVMTHEKLYRIK